MNAEAAERGKRVRSCQRFMGWRASWLRLAACLRLLHRRPCPWGAGQLPHPHDVGRYGELVAASWLRSCGWRVLRHNFRWGESGEIDLVCRDGESLIFVEVKSGTVAGPYPLAHKVNKEKRHRLRSGARSWFHLLGHHVPHRFDIVEVQLQAGKRPVLNHIVNAFEPLVLQEGQGPEDDAR